MEFKIGQSPFDAIAIFCEIAPAVGSILEIIDVDKLDICRSVDIIPPPENAIGIIA